MNDRLAHAGAYRRVLFDVDGVLIRGDQQVPGAGEAVARLRTAGAGVAFITNNASRTAEAVAAHLRATGIGAAAGEVVTSALAGAALLDPGARVLVVGMEGLREAVRARGCTIVEDPGEVQAVIVGLDRELTWDTLRRATYALRAGARFIATNRDATLPLPDGLAPGAGAIVAALVTASDREPEVAGKPHAPLFRAAADALAARGHDGPVLVVGDRLETDIAGAAALGWDTAFVLTGVSTTADLGRLGLTPTYVAPSLADLIP